MTLPELLIQDFVENASDRVARSFSRRLGYLHESQVAQEIVRKWLEPNGRYGDLASLNKIGCDIFGNIAPVHQEAALDALERATQDSVFVSTDNFLLGHCGRIARALAYESSLFEQAIEVLVRFAIAEPDGNTYGSIRHMLQSLFYCHLSGTEAKSDQRSKVARELILSDDKGRQKLGFLILGAALQTDQFTSVYEFDFGARKRGFGWWPCTHDDVVTWYKPFINIAIDVGKKNTIRGEEARVVLAKSLRGLWGIAGVRNEICAAAKEFL